MARRLLPLLALALALVLSAAASAGDNYGDQKASVDAKLNALHTKIAGEQAKESRLSSQIGSLTSQDPNARAQGRQRVVTARVAAVRSPAAPAAAGQAQLSCSTSRRCDFVF